jgi:hypothetical protein
MSTANQPVTIRIGIPISRYPAKASLNGGGYNSQPVYFSMMMSRIGIGSSSGAR